MKNLMKFVILLFVFLALSVISYIIIFSQSMKFGIVAGFILILLCFVLFLVTIVGLVIGNLKFVLLRNRIEVLGLMVLSVFLAVIIGLLTFANATVEQFSQDLDLA